jgi:Fe-S cluster assembly protein SufD
MSFTEALESQYKAALVRSEGADERAFREHAWAQYSRLGLPDRKTETWKYSSLAALTRGPWDLAAPSIDIPERAVAMIARWNEIFDIMLVVNGEPRGLPPAGVSVLNFTPSDRVWFEDGWIGLSAALARPGFELRVARNVRLKKPLLFLHVQTGGKAMAPSLHRIVLSEGARAQVAQAFVGSGGPGFDANTGGAAAAGADENYLRTEITLADLGDRAELDWVRVQFDDAGSNHFSEVQCRLGEDAKLYQTQLNAGAAWNRSTLRAEIQGERAEAHIGGLTFARGSQHCDQRVEVRHLAPNTISHQLFKGVLKDRARGVLNGKIYIHRGAQKVVSSQLNHNLLLTPMAEADTKPELEIYADDVKANHGASIGKLDEDKVFYLMSRGITRAKAQQMLAEAFVADVLMKIPSKKLRYFANKAVHKVLPDFSTGMEAKV